MENVTLDQTQVEEAKTADRRDSALQEIEADNEPSNAKQILSSIITGQSNNRFSTPTVSQEVTEEPEEEKKETKAEGEAEDTKAESEKPEQEETEETEAKEEIESDPGAQDSGEDVQASEPLPEPISESLKAAFPDEEITSENVSDYMGQLVTSHQNLQAEREANEKVYQIFENSEEMVQVAKKMNEGHSFMQALASSINIDETLNDLKENDPAEYKKVLKAQVEREKQIEEQQEKQAKLEQTWAENEKESKTNLDKFKQEKKLEPKKSEEFLNTIEHHFNNLVYGKMTPEFLDTMYKGLEHDQIISEYDKKIEAAKEQGRVEGRNEKIEVEKSKKTGDGLPQMPKGGSKDNKKASETASSGKRVIAGIAASGRSSFT